MGVCQNPMHERPTFQSCTDFRRSTAVATWRLILSPTTQHLPFMVLTNLGQKTNHGVTTDGLTVTSTQVSLTREQPAFTQVPSDLEYTMPPNHRTPTTSRLPKAPRYMFAHWAPLSDDTKTTRATFQQWVFTVPALSESSIPWAQATCTPDGRISVAISNDRQLATLRDIGPFSQMTNPTFVRTSYLGEDLALTIAMLHNESLAPLIIAPVPNNASIAIITRELVMLRTQPVFGPTTNFKKVAP